MACQVIVYGLVCVRVSGYPYMCVYVCACVCVCVCARHICVCFYVYFHVCMYACMYICIRICMRMYLLGEEGWGGRECVYVCILQIGSLFTDARTTK